jgi:exopolysaccharide biosynthesis polyprenyl glycosylphosphotransferase
MSKPAQIRLREAEVPTRPEPPRLAIAAPAPEPIFDVGQLRSSAEASNALESQGAIRRRLLALADAAAVAAMLVVVLSRFGLGSSTIAALASIPLVLILFKLGGLYDRDELRLHHSTLDEAPVLLQFTGLFALAAVILYPIFFAGSFTPAQAAVLWFTAFATTLTGRILARSVARWVVPDERCLIIGDAQRADQIRRGLAASRARTVVVGCLAGDDLSSHHGLTSVLEVVRDLRVDRIILAPGGSATNDAVELIRVAKVVGIKVSVLPRLLQVVGSAVALDEVEGMALLGVPRIGLRRSSRWVKRVVDLVATAVGLVVVSPLLAVIACAVRLDSKGPIFYRQIRIGRDGKPFRIVKFRSMVIGAEAQKDQLRAQNIAGHGLFKVTNDPRVTRLGRFLRSSSLDELPQLFNVLRGEMSLVGPRPLVTDEDAQVLGLDRSRLLLTPGITGPWQTLGSRVPLQEMVEIDYLYASNWSLWLDLKILLRTLRHVVRRGNV